jgi:hypothetical protein
MAALIQHTFSHTPHALSGPGGLLIIMTSDSRSSSSSNSDRDLRVIAWHGVSAWHGREVSWEAWLGRVAGGHAVQWALLDKVARNVALAAHIGGWDTTGSLWAVTDEVTTLVATVANVASWWWIAGNIGRAVLDQVSGLLALVADVARGSGLVQGTLANEVTWDVALAADVARWRSAPSIQGTVLDKVSGGVALLANVRAHLSVWAVANKMAGHAALVANV